MTRSRISVFIVILAFVFVVLPGIRSCQENEAPSPLFVVGIATTTVHASREPSFESHMADELRDVIGTIEPPAPYDLIVLPVAADERGVDYSPAMGYVRRRTIYVKGAASRVTVSAFDRRLRSIQSHPNLPFVAVNLTQWFKEVSRTVGANDRRPVTVMVVGSGASLSKSIDTYSWKRRSDATAARTAGAKLGGTLQCTGIRMTILGNGNVFAPASDPAFTPVPDGVYQNAVEFWRSLLHACGGTLGFVRPF
jgi:hypothetical protein